MTIDVSKLPKIQQFNLKEYPRGSKYPGQITNSCNVPYYTLIIDSRGDCFVCSCEAWLPIPVGNILEFDSLEDIWDSPIAKEIQQDVNDKKFTYCAVEHCNLLNKSYNVHQYEITISMDESCNLACPTCRSGPSNITSGPQFEKSKKLINHFVTLIQKFNKPTTLIMTGNGDVLASMLYRPLLLNWQPTENHSIILRTNGLLMKKLLPDSPVLAHIKEFHISMDAGSAEVYENVRRPGKHKVLLENLDWLFDYQNTQTKRPRSLYNFVLQSANAGDIVNFAILCNHYKSDGVIAKLDNWGAQPLMIYNDMQVLTTSHPLYKTAMDQLLMAKQIKPNIHFAPLIEQQVRKYQQTV